MASVIGGGAVFEPRLQFADLPRHDAQLLSHVVPGRLKIGKQRREAVVGLSNCPRFAAVNDRIAALPELSFAFHDVQQ